MSIAPSKDASRRDSQFFARSNPNFLPQDGGIAVTRQHLYPDPNETSPWRSNVKHRDVSLSMTSVTATADEWKTGSLLIQGFHLLKYYSGHGVTRLEKHGQGTRITKTMASQRCDPASGRFIDRGGDKSEKKVRCLSTAYHENHQLIPNPYSLAPLLSIPWIPKTAQFEHHNQHIRKHTYSLA